MMDEVSLPTKKQSNANLSSQFPNFRLYARCLLLFPSGAMSNHVSNVTWCNTFAPSSN